MERREILESLADHPLTREFASWLFDVEEDADEMLRLSIAVSDGELTFNGSRRDLIESFLARLGEFSLRRVYGSTGNLAFFIIPKIWHPKSEEEDVLLHLYILELKTGTVAAILEHDGNHFTAEDVEYLLKNAQVQLQRSKGVIAVRVMVE